MADPHSAQVLQEVYRCSICDDATENIHKLLDHLRDHNKQSDESSEIACPVEDCTKVLRNYNCFRTHMYRIHSYRKSRTNRIHMKNDHEASEDIGCLIIEDEISMQNLSSLKSEVTEAPLENVLEPRRKSDLIRQTALFILKSREVRLVPHSSFNAIIADMKDFITSTAGSESHDFFEVYNNLNTEAKLKRYCKENLNLVEPQTLILGEEIVNGRSVQHTYQYIPILQTLNGYLKNTDIVNVANNATHTDSTNFDSEYTMSSYCDGLIFEESAFFKKNASALRIILYTDEFEVTNALGAKKGIHKLMPVYFIVDNIDQDMKSSLRHIHLCLLIKYRHVKKYGYHAILKPLYDDLKKLENEGINISINGNDRTIFGTMIALCSDNLSSHALGGFNQSFSAGRICRFCLAKKI